MKPDSVSLTQALQALAQKQGIALWVGRTTDEVGRSDAMTLAHKSAMPFLPVSYAMQKWHVGPLTQPGKTGCASCVQEWEANNQPQKTLTDVRRTDAPLALGAGLSPCETVAILSELVVMLCEQDKVSDDTLAPSFASYYRFDESSQLIDRHPLMPLPGCPCCGHLPADSARAAKITLRERLKSSPDQFRTVNEALSETRLREHYVDYRSGLIRHLFKSTTSDILPMVGSEMALLGETAQENGYGRTGSVSGSVQVAILEALERFCGHAPRARKTAVRDSASGLTRKGQPFVHPKTFILHDDSEALSHKRTTRPYSDDLEHNWVWAHSFASDSAVLIPEQLAYYRVDPTAAQPVNRYVYECSNGCAMGGSVEEAIFYGLLEVIERDAYMTTWYGRITPVELDVTHCPNNDIRFMLACSEARGYQVHVFDITMETGVPTIWAMIRNPADDAPVASYCAAGAHPDPEKAILGALVEIITSMNVYEKSMPEMAARARELVNDHAKVESMHDHVLLYSQPETLSYLDFLFSGAPKQPLTTQFADWYQNARSRSLTDELKNLLQRVCAHFGDVVAIDQSFEGLKPAGVNAVKVFVPGTHTISFGHQYRRASLARTNQALSFRQLPVLEHAHALNPLPHNFP